VSVRATGTQGPTTREPAAAQLGRRRRPGLRRAVVVDLVLIVGLLLGFVLSLSIGDFRIPPLDVVRTLAGGGSGASHFVVVDLRLPRALSAVGTGLALGLAGALFQALLRNPLASPDMIGVTQGAAVGAVLASIGFGASGLVLSGSALAGAVLTAAAIYLLAWQRGVAGYRLILVGIGAAGGLGSVVSYLMTTAQVDVAQDALVWLAGSLNGVSLQTCGLLFAALAVLLPVTAVAARPLPALQLGDDTAAGLGVGVERSRRMLLGCAVALTAVAVAAAGPVAFVAFVSGPVARQLVPGRGAALVRAAGIGALLMLVADFAAQHLLWSTQFPVGVVTSLIGAPYLLYLLARANRIGKGG